MRAKSIPSIPKPESSPTLTPEAFGTRLMLLRIQRHDWSVADLARRVGLRNEQIRDWENGRSFPVLASFILLADALGVTLDYLVGREKNDVS